MTTPTLRERAEELLRGIKATRHPESFTERYLGDLVRETQRETLCPTFEEWVNSEPFAKPFTAGELVVAGAAFAAGQRTASEDKEWLLEQLEEAIGYCKCDGAEIVQGVIDAAREGESDSE